MKEKIACSCGMARANKTKRLIEDTYHCNYKSSQTPLHGPSMFTVKAKIYGVLYNQASSIAFDETSSYWSALKSS